MDGFHLHVFWMVACFSIGIILKNPKNEMLIDLWYEVEIVYDDDAFYFRREYLGVLIPIKNYSQLPQSTAWSYADKTR